MKCCHSHQSWRGGSVLSTCPERMTWCGILNAEILLMNKIPLDIVKCAQKSKNIFQPSKTVVGGCFMKRDDSRSLIELKPSFRKNPLQSQLRPWNWSQEGTYSPPWRENLKSMRTDPSGAAKMENHGYLSWQQNLFQQMLTKMSGWKWHIKRRYI